MYYMIPLLSTITTTITIVVTLVNTMTFNPRYTHTVSNFSDVKRIYSGKEFMRTQLV